MLQILNNVFAAQVRQDIIEIASDPILEIDPTTGVVYYDLKPTTAFIGPATVWDLVTRTGIFIGVRGEASNFSIAPLPNMRVADQGGYVIFDDPLDPRQIEIVYDVEQCGGSGVWVKGAGQTSTQSTDRIDMPTHVVLFHEMRHALQVIARQWIWDLATRESKAIEDENVYRKEKFLPVRTGHEGGCKGADDEKPKTKGFFESYRDAGGGGGGGKCFVATASFGSELDPNVEFLRRFRDDVIRATRTGDRFWRRYWERYQRLSPTVVEMIERDPELRDLVRWSLVQPIVHYLELVQSFPDAPLDDVPEPWRSWLEGERSKLANWLGEIELPTEFEGLDPDAIVAEVAFLLRYVLRTSDDRSDYVEKLQASGALPVSVTPEERVRLAEELWKEPATAEWADAILGPHRSHPLMTAYGGEHMFTLPTVGETEWLYSVAVGNATTDTFEEIVIMYKRSNESGIVYLTEENVAPGEIRLFTLGLCSVMESYVIGFYLNGTLAFNFPPTGNLTPAGASALKPEDTLPCGDAWVIEE